MNTKKSKPYLLPITPDLSFELALWEQGIRFVAGVDEAGRGALAGPVAAAAVILPNDAKVQSQLQGVKDSKQMTPAQREYWAVCIQKIAVGYGVGFSTNQEIDTLGILPATHLAILRALAGLPVAPQHLLVDYLELPGISIPQTGLVKGDSRSLSIAAASVLAKTARDAYMRQLDRLYPDYGFRGHKGYGTLDHRGALRKFGLSPIHRRSFQFKIPD